MGDENLSDDIGDTVVSPPPDGVRVAPAVLEAVVGASNVGIVVAVLEEPGDPGSFRYV